MDDTALFRSCFGLHHPILPELKDPIVEIDAYR